MAVQNSPPPKFLRAMYKTVYDGNKSDQIWFHKCQGLLLVRKFSQGRKVWTDLSFSRPGTLIPQLVSLTVTRVQLSSEWVRRQATKKAWSSRRLVCSFVSRCWRKPALPPQRLLKAAYSVFVEREGLTLPGGALQISAASNRVAPCGSQSPWRCVKWLIERGLAQPKLSARQGIPWVFKKSEVQWRRSWGMG